MQTTTVKPRSRKGSGKPSRKRASPKLKQPATVEPGSPGTEISLQEESHGAFDPDLRHRMIREAAYYLYVQRGFVDGYDVDDWLEAEAQVDDLIMNPEQEDSLEVSAPLASP